MTDQASPPPEASVGPARDGTSVGPALDEKRTAASFVNILFGLVIAGVVVEIVTALRVGYVEDIDAIHASRVSHLLLAMLVASLSWLGYHQGPSRPFVIRYVNIPLVIFVLDIGLVASYYALIVVAEHPGGDGHAAIPADARPEAVLLALVFLLYLAWDEANYRLHSHDRYVDALDGFEKQGKRGHDWWVTAVASGVAVALAGAVILVHPETPRAVIVVDLVLAGLAVAYRLFKQRS